MITDLRDVPLVPSWIPERLKIEGAGDRNANQSQEQFTAAFHETRHTFSMHDYRSMYRVPWLYDTMIYDLLECKSPYGLAHELRVYLETKCNDLGTTNSLRILEIGAGSGAFGVLLRAAQLPQTLVGLDILEEARNAAERDRPYLYDQYIVDDLTALSADSRAALDVLNPNCVAVASATGWGNHIPVAGFQAAFDILIPGGIFVFHVKPNDPDPECISLVEWIESLSNSGAMVDVTEGSLFHRKSVRGADIYYDFRIGRKSTAQV